MDLATGAMNTLLPKLAELVVGEYKLQKGVKAEIKELEEELTSMTAALHKVAEVPPDQLDEQVKIWARDVRELSYDIEDQLDTFLLRGKEHDHTKPFSLKGLIGKATDLCKKAKTNHKIHNVVKDIIDQVKMVAERRDRYKVDNIAASAGMVAVDPRLEGMYRKATELVGIGRPKNELAKRLLEQDCSSPSRQQTNIMSIFGFGGLGKTTLANSLLQDLKAKFDCHIFVSVSLNPDIMMIFKNILLQLNDKKCVNKDEPWEMKHLIDRIIELLKNRRCLCVIDDLWKESAWDAIKLAFHDGHPGSKIIITTRYKNVAEHVGGGVYELKPLSNVDSRKLFNKRIFDTDDMCPASLVEVTEKILKKCGGVPLAIITIASLLASKPMCLEAWEKVNKYFGSGLGDSLDVNKMRKILSLSYNDLPFHLKTCLLSLSKYPEDHLIRKDVLVCSWLAEGFIKQETRGPAGNKSLQEIAESYFNDLINRSLIQPARSNASSEQHDDGQLHCCQVHDMVLELINWLSAEEGFVTVLFSEDGQQESTLTSAVDTQKRKIRRLSLHNSIEFPYYIVSPKARIKSYEQLSKVRSLDIFGNVKSIPPLSSFPVLRVLQVHNCLRLGNHHLNDLGKLRLLRFLRLYEIDELPESIGELESLETLDIRRHEDRDYYSPIFFLFERRSPIVLPVSFAKLRKLVRLLSSGVELPDGLTLENMASLRELVGLQVSLHAVTEVGKLGGLKVLGLHVPTKSRSIADRLIIKCLQLCPDLQIFDIRAESQLNAGSYTYYSCPMDLMAQLPSGLRTFTTGKAYFNGSECLGALPFGLYYGSCAFPKWTKPQLSYLTVLQLRLWNVCVLPKHLEQLAELPSLRSLYLESLLQPGKQEKLSSASGFPCLTHLELWDDVLFLEFQQGAMPKLQKLNLGFAPKATNEHFGTSNFSYGLDNLPSLRHIVIILNGKKCAEVEDAIRKAVKDLPKHPSLDLFCPL